MFAVVGAESWEDIEDLGKHIFDFLKQYGDENGITVHNYLQSYYPVSVLQNFTSALLTGCVIAIHRMNKDVVAIDGKTLRHSY